MNLADALTSAAATLDAAGIAESRREASSLLSFVLSRPGSFLFAHPEYELTTDERSRFDECVQRRSKREPFQYITGVQEFFGLDFEVAPGVLIPRPETEILVETAISKLPSTGSPNFLEIGIGSGCISVSILKSVPNSKAIGVDISPAAIVVAGRNAAKHGVSERFTIREGSLFADIDVKFELIVSNPPYIPDGDIGELQPEVRDFEPRTALAGGASGLEMVERIVREAPFYLTPGGWLILEIGFGQSGSVRELLHTQIWDSVDVIPDLQGIPRTIVARYTPDGALK
jgi:release factor glutamine methyltransferase